MGRSRKMGRNHESLDFMFNYVLVILKHKQQKMNLKLMRKTKMIESIRLSENASIDHSA